MLIKGIPLARGSRRAAAQERAPCRDSGTHVLTLVRPSILVPPAHVAPVHVQGAVLWARGPLRLQQRLQGDGLCQGRRYRPHRHVQHLRASKAQLPARCAGQVRRRGASQASGSAAHARSAASRGSRRRLPLSCCGAAPIHTASSSRSLASSRRATRLLVRTLCRGRPP